MDRGDDFATLRAILEGAFEDDGNGRHGSGDSGYFSRRSSKAIGTGGGKRDLILVEEIGETIEGVEREDSRDDDDRAEEADDEGAGLEELEEEEEEEEEEKGEGDGEANGPDNGKGDQDQAEEKRIAQPTKQTLTTEHANQFYPQMPIGTSFISPRRPAEPRISADEAMFARPRHPGAGK